MFKKFLKRFERLENTGINNDISTKNGLKSFRRFERLEINDRKIEFTITDKIAPEEKAPPTVKYYVLCHHCGQENPSDAKFCGFCKRPIETDYISDYPNRTNILKKCVCGAVNLKERKNCWVCGRDFSLWGDSEVSERAENIITLNINGTIYKSTDDNLPPGIIALMEKIRREGYSETLINDWMREVNEETDLKQNEITTRLSTIKINLAWSIIGLVLFLVFMIFQLSTCIRYSNNFH